MAKQNERHDNDENDFGLARDKHTRSSYPLTDLPRDLGLRFTAILKIRPELSPAFGSVLQWTIGRDHCGEASCSVPSATEPRAEYTPQGITLIHNRSFYYYY